MPNGMAMQGILQLATENPMTAVNITMNAKMTHTTTGMTIADLIEFSMGKLFFDSSTVSPPIDETSNPR